MRVTKSGGTSAANGGRRGARVPGGEFKIESNSSAAGSLGAVAASTGTGEVAAVSDVDSILALQGIGQVDGHRENALRKGRRMLDALEKLSLSYLDNNTSPMHLKLLENAAGVVRRESGDKQLDEALDQVEVRLAVEIAKLERSNRK